MLNWKHVIYYQCPMCGYVSYSVQAYCPRCGVKVVVWVDADYHIWYADGYARGLQPEPECSCENWTAFNYLYKNN